MRLNLKKVIWAQTTLILILTFSLLIIGGDLRQTRKMTLDQSNFCIKYTSDIIANSQITLIREQNAHGRTLDKSNTMIVDIINRYNALVAKYNKKTVGIDYDPLNQYSYLIIKTNP